MVMQPEKRYFTVDEWRAYEQDTGERYEYIDGEIYMMSGGTDTHSQIGVNVTTSLTVKLRGRGCRVYNSDLRVRITDTKYVYPDATVVCSDPTFADDTRTMLTNPVLVVEVASPSSANYDRGMKSEYYRSIDSIAAYVVIDQDRAAATLYTRHEIGWLLQDFKGVDASVYLEPLEITLSLSEIYEGITFEQADAKSEE